MHVLALLDDTSISNNTEEEHLDSSGIILDTPLESGVRLKLFKCTFGVRKAEILGQVVDGSGLRPFEKHADCIQILLKSG